jgi:hypothetical protein
MKKNKPVESQDLNEGVASGLIGKEQLEIVRCSFTSQTPFGFSDFFSCLLLLSNICIIFA